MGEGSVRGVDGRCKGGGGTVGLRAADGRRAAGCPQRAAGDGRRAGERRVGDILVVANPSSGGSTRHLLPGGEKGNGQAQPVAGSPRVCHPAKIPGWVPPRCLAAFHGRLGRRDGRSEPPSRTLGEPRVRLGGLFAPFLPVECDGPSKTPGPPPSTWNGAGWPARYKLSHSSDLGWCCSSSARAGLHLRRPARDFVKARRTLGDRAFGRAAARKAG